MSYKSLDTEKLLLEYAKAQERMSMWLSGLQITYDLCMPQKAKFTVKNFYPGQKMTQHVYDHTAPNALIHFADGIETNLMPPSTHWIRFEPAEELKETEEKESVKSALEFYENTVFEVLNKSNFYSQLTPSVEEMAISTGVLLINETDDKEIPIKFTSVPLHECCFGGQPGGEITKVWRKFKVEGQELQNQWPQANIPDTVLRDIADNPYTEYDLIEGSIPHQGIKENDKYCYFVMLEAEKVNIVEEPRSYFPWTIFRPSVSSGELLGRGPMFRMESALRIINRMAQDELQANKWQTAPMFLDASGSSVNTYTAILCPDSIIPVTNKDDLTQLRVETNTQFNQLQRQSYREDILNALGVNSFQATDSTGKTATEVNVVNDARLLHNHAVAARLQNELCVPIIEKVFAILAKKGYWRMPKLDRKHIKVTFDSPVVEAQNQININKIVKYSQTLNEILGPQLGPTGIAYGLDIMKVTNYVSKEMHLSSEVIRDALSQANMLKHGAQMTQGQQQPPQAPQMSDQLATQGAQNGQQQSGSNQLA